MEQVTNTINEFTGRISKLEANDENIFYQLKEIKQDVSDIRRLTVAVERIAVKTEEIGTKVNDIDCRLDRVEKEPSEDYKHYKRSAVTVIITGVVGAVIGAVMTLIFNK